MIHNEFEKKVMEMLLFGDNLVLEGLRDQYKNRTVESREFTGVGFYSNFRVDPMNWCREVAKRGDTIYLATQSAREGSVYEAELSFFLSNGYRQVGRYLVKAK